MIPRFLLDTNICVYIRQKKPAAILARFRELRPGEAAMSVITQGELLYGAERSRDPERALESLAELTVYIPVIALPEEAAAAYGQIRAGLEKRGMLTGNNDLWIAAHARSAGLIVVTNNQREFKRIPGLRLENWIVRG